jgi:hypothetical protein
LFAGGTALAGLVLVFLGGILTAYDSYETEDKSAVAATYKRRAWLAFAGFLFALLAATSGLIGLMRGPAPWLTIGVFALGISGVLLLLMAVLSVRGIN